MSASLTDFIANGLARMLPESLKTKPAAPSYRLLKAHAKDPVQFRHAVNWLKDAEKGGNEGKDNAKMAIKLVQRLSFTDPNIAIALLDRAKDSNNPDLRTAAIALHASLSAQETRPATEIARSAAAQPALKTLSQ